MPDLEKQAGDEPTELVEMIWVAYCLFLVFVGNYEGHRVFETGPLRSREIEASGGVCPQQIFVAPRPLIPDRELWPTIRQYPFGRPPEAYCSVLESKQ